MATSLFGLLQGGAQQAVRDAAVAEHPRALQRAQGAVSAGTLRSGANPVAVSRQYAQQTADMGARLAEQQKRALAQAKMEDAAGASQLLGHALGGAMSLGAMALPGAQAAKPFVDMAVDKGTTALGRALSQPSGGVPDPRGALAGAQPVQGSQQPLTASEAVPPPNPYEDPNVRGMMGAPIMPLNQNMLGYAPGSPFDTLNDLDAQDAPPAPTAPGVLAERTGMDRAQAMTAGLGQLSPQTSAAPAAPQAQPAARPRPQVSVINQLPPTNIQGSPQQPTGPGPQAPPPGYAARYAAPTLSGTSPAEVQQAQQQEFNSRMGNADITAADLGQYNVPPVLPRGVDVPPIPYTYEPTLAGLPPLPQPSPQELAAQQEFNNRMAGSAQAERLAGTIQRNAGPPPVVTSQEQIARGRAAQVPALMSYLATQQADPEQGAVNPSPAQVGWSPAELEAMRRSTLRQEQERSLMDRGADALSAVGSALGSYFGF